MTSDNTCIIGCFQLKNENPMCEHPAHQVNVSRIGVLCAPDSSNFFLGYPVYLKYFSNKNPTSRTFGIEFSEQNLTNSVA